MSEHRFVKLAGAERTITEEAAKWCVVASRGVPDVAFLEQVANDVGLLRSPMEMPADRRHYFGTILWTTLPQRVGLDVLVGPFLRIEFRAALRELNQADVVGVGGAKLLRDTRTRHRMPVCDEIDLAARLLPEAAYDLDERRRAEGPVKDTKDELAAAAARLLARRSYHRRLVNRGVIRARTWSLRSPISSTE